MNAKAYADRQYTRYRITVKPVIPNAVGSLIGFVSYPSHVPYEDVRDDIQTRYPVPVVVSAHLTHATPWPDDEEFPDEWKIFEDT